VTKHEADVKGQELSGWLMKRFRDHVAKDLTPGRRERIEAALFSWSVFETYEEWFEGWRVSIQGNASSSSATPAPTDNTQKHKGSSNRAFVLLLLMRSSSQATKSGVLPPGGCPGNPICGLSARFAAL